MASSKRVTVETVTQVRQLVAARSWAWCRQNGYSGSDEQYLDEAGLSGYRTNVNARTTLSSTVGALLNRLGADTVISFAIQNPNDMRHVVDGFAEALYSALRRVDGGLTAGTDYTVPPVSPDAIDPRTYLGRAADSYEFAAPEFTTDEARAEAQRIVTSALATADKNRACGSVENLITGIGFAEFMPPAETRMSVDVPGFGLVEFTVENNRCGEPRQDRMEVKIRNAIGAKVAEMITAGTVAAAQPVTAAA